MDHIAKKKWGFGLGMLAAIWVVGAIFLFAASSSASPGTRVAGESSGAVAALVAAICAAVAANRRRKG